jgi:hypothetical protein
MYLLVERLGTARDVRTINLERNTDLSDVGWDKLQSAIAHMDCAVEEVHCRLLHSGLTEQGGSRYYFI